MTKIKYQTRKISRHFKAGFCTVVYGTAPDAKFIEFIDTAKRSDFDPDNIGYKIGVEVAKDCRNVFLFSDFEKSLSSYVVDYLPEYVDKVRNTYNYEFDKGDLYMIKQFLFDLYDVWDDFRRFKSYDEIVRGSFLEHSMCDSVISYYACMSVYFRDEIWIDAETKAFIEKAKYYIDCGIPLDVVNNSVYPVLSHWDVYDLMNLKDNDSIDTFTYRKQIQNMLEFSKYRRGLDSEYIKHDLIDYFSKLIYAKEYYA